MEFVEIVDFGYNFYLKNVNRAATVTKNCKNSRI